MVFVVTAKGIVIAVGRCREREKRQVFVAYNLNIYTVVKIISIIVDYIYNNNNNNNNK